MENESNSLRGSRGNFPPEIMDGKFRFVQERLQGGAVYKSEKEYLRLGERVVTMTEEVQTVALGRKGFPVAEVTGHGEIDGNWYFTETSLGNDHFGNIFRRDYEKGGQVSEANFLKFMAVMGLYTRASFGTKNRTLHRESLRDISLFRETRDQYPIDPDLMDKLIVKAGKRLVDMPNGIICGDLGPFNILPGGVIDFEFLHTGPLGYDVMMVPTIGYYFPKVPGFKRKQLFAFSSDQLARYYEMVQQEAQSAGISDPTEFFNEFIFLKTVWAASRPRGYENKEIEDPEREKFFSHFRHNILRYVVECYKRDAEIDPVLFPDIGVNGKW